MEGRTGHKGVSEAAERALELDERVPELVWRASKETSNKPEASGRLPKSHLGGFQRQLGGPQREMGGPQREMGGPQREMGGPQREMEGPQRQLGFGGNW